MVEVLNFDQNERLVMVAVSEGEATSISVLPFATMFWATICILGSVPLTPSPLTSSKASLGLIKFSSPFHQKDRGPGSSGTHLALRSSILIEPLDSILMNLLVLKCIQAFEPQSRKIMTGSLSQALSPSLQICPIRNEVQCSVMLSRIPYWAKVKCEVESMRLRCMSWKSTLGVKLNKSAISSLMKEMRCCRDTCIVTVFCPRIGEPAMKSRIWGGSRTSLSVAVKSDAVCERKVQKSVGADPVQVRYSVDGNVHDSELSCILGSARVCSDLPSSRNLVIANDRSSGSLP